MSEYTKYEDYDYDKEWWKLRIGNPTTQQYGYIAERLFIDEADVANSPRQFGSTQVMAGDIKYRDLNGDGIINDRDMAPIGYPTTPEIQYGFGSSIGINAFDFSFFFNGVQRRLLLDRLQRHLALLQYHRIKQYTGSCGHNA